MCVCVCGGGGGGGETGVLQKNVCFLSPNLLSLILQKGFCQMKNRGMGGKGKRNQKKG